MAAVSIKKVYSSVLPLNLVIVARLTTINKERIPKNLVISIPFAV